MMAEKSDVGYGKPPKKSQFKKGESGNPKGRPKGSLSFKTLMKKQLERTYEITDEGRRVRVTGAELLARQTFKKALDGSLGHLDRALEHMPEEPGPFGLNLLS